MSAFSHKRTLLAVIALWKFSVAVALLQWLFEDAIRPKLEPPPTASSNEAIVISKSQHSKIVNCTDATIC